MKELVNVDTTTFWKIVDSVSAEVAGADHDGIIKATQWKLREFNSEEIEDWYSIQSQYSALANTCEVFCAACLIDGIMTNDGFADFRMWLISRGKEVYLDALKDPDSLAGLSIYGNVRFEEYGYVALNLISTPVTDRTLLVAEILSAPYKIRCKEDMKKFLPKLYAKFDGDGVTSLVYAGHKII